MPLTADQRLALRAGLLKAAEHFEKRAAVLDERVERWRRDHPKDDAPIIATTLHGVVRELRTWAAKCGE